VTPESILDPVDRQNPVQPPSTVGMTTKVVKGSIWTLAGQVAPLAVSLVTTPFVIRMLGPETYGVLILVGLIPTYLGFADFGMGLASTKFGSEAYAEGDVVREAAIVRTGALIALSTSVPVAIAMILFSPQIISFFNVPENLRSDASLALKLASITFVVNFLNGIVNVPQLARLRMDLNTTVTAGFRILGLIAMPFAVYYVGFVAAVFVLLISSLFTLFGHLYFSWRLSRHLFGGGVDRSVARSMIKFGVAILGVGVAGAVLMNAEKGIVAAAVSAEALAFYSVGFTLAGMLVFFSTAIIQSLVPAFSQLLRPETTGQLQDFFTRIVRVVLLVLIPLTAFLCCMARDFIRVWAGDEFARESTYPFFILLFGLLFSVPGYVPYSLVMAKGRADVIAKLYWLELLPYLALIFALTWAYGILGAAAAWGLRVAFDGVVFFLLAKKISKAELRVFEKESFGILVALTVYLPMVVVSVQNRTTISAAPLLMFLSGTLVYLAIVWKLSIRPEERQWLKAGLLRFGLLKHMSN
jgi:O-antigen/teichoic acid export membrane protein